MPNLWSQVAPLAVLNPYSLLEESVHMALLYIMLSTIPVDSFIFNLKNNTISCFPGGKYFLEPFRCEVYDALLYYSVLRKNNISASAINNPCLY
jgi:hypothetical protein